MTFDATSLRAKVLAVCTDLGGTGVLTDYSSSYSTATGKATLTATEHTIQVSPTYTDRLVTRGDGQPRGDAQIVVHASGLTVTLRPSQKLEVNGQSWTVTEVEPYRVSGTLIAYELTIARGAPA